MEVVADRIYVADGIAGLLILPSVLNFQDTHRAFSAVGVYPNGISSFSPALPMESATPGNGQENGINPERVASFAMGTRT